MSGPVCTCPITGARVACEAHPPTFDRGADLLRAASAVADWTDDVHSGNAVRYARLIIELRNAVGRAKQPGATLIGALDERDKLAAQLVVIRKDWNAILHPDGGERMPLAFCDLLAVTAAELQKVPRWIPCSERMPKQHQQVLVMAANARDPFCAAWFEWRDRSAVLRRTWHQDTEHLRVDGNATIEAEDMEVTHWMPMPEGPKP